MKMLQWDISSSFMCILPLPKKPMIQHLKDICPMRDPSPSPPFKKKNDTNTSTHTQSNCLKRKKNGMIRWEKSTVCPYDPIESNSISTEYLPPQKKNEIVQYLRLIFLMQSLSFLFFLKKKKTQNQIHIDKKNNRVLQLYEPSPFLATRPTLVLSALNSH